MIRYRIVHRTEYHYGAPMTASHTVARLTPRDTGTQHVLSSSLAVTPVPEQLSHLDEFGNRLSYLAVTEPHDTLALLPNWSGEASLSQRDIRWRLMCRWKRRFVKGCRVSPICLTRCRS